MLHSAKALVAHLVGALSLVLLLTTSALWIRSYFWPDWFLRNSALNADREYTFDAVRSIRGFIEITHTYRRAYPGWEPEHPEGWGRTPLFVAYHIWSGGSQFLGARFGKEEFIIPTPDGSASVERTHILVLPYWQIIAVLIVSSLVYALRLQRSLRRRLARTQDARATPCPTCNYDLRAHPPNSNCPECGTPIAPTHRLIQSHLC